ncbi:hypothetical protein [Nonomuraea soli]|uniref:Uncharacterized protein n=1 Tax=Nonomuraea soli TaxID=1032476 RepID=A0A7W0HW47_9ACTN|nr:hypothetical protein [Nonomuraea soli]MBA2897727.1 hypothetical protein [Nonomuraea soli]
MPGSDRGEARLVEGSVSGSSSSPVVDSSLGVLECTVPSSGSLGASGFVEGGSTGAAWGVDSPG